MYKHKKYILKCRMFDARKDKDKPTAEGFGLFVAGPNRILSCARKAVNGERMFAPTAAGLAELMHNHEIRLDDITTRVREDSLFPYAISDESGRAYYLQSMGMNDEVDFFSRYNSMIDSERRVIYSINRGARAAQDGIRKR